VSEKDVRRREREKKVRRKKDVGRKEERKLRR